MSSSQERGFDINEKYQQKSDLEHVLLRPDTYVGGLDSVEKEEWICDLEKTELKEIKITYSPALYKIIDEILVNARDHTVRDLTCNKIRVDIDKETGQITVENNGQGIPIEFHEAGQCWLPELVFGRFRTGENFSDDDKKTVGGRNGFGATCLSADTLIPLWTGKYKRADEIMLDDQLIGDDGRVRNIQNVIHGKGKMYKVKQANGESYTVNDQHILSLHMPDHKVIFWNAAKNGWCVLWWNRQEKCINAKTESVGTVNNYVTCDVCEISLSGNLQRHYRRIHKGVETPEKKRNRPTLAPNTAESRAARERLEKFCLDIPDDSTFDINIQDYLNLSHTAQKRLAGFRGGCVNWSKQAVYLDPYILGLWLGDGMSTGYRYACFGEKDPEIIEYFQKWCEENDAEIVQDNTYEYRVRAKDNANKKNPLARNLRKYGLIQNKHIPIEYIVNDRETRLKVLAGLIDTDGAVFRNGTRVVISQALSHKAIIEGTLLLARSLGFYCCLTIKMSQDRTLNGRLIKGGPFYNLNITGNLEEIPTKLPRKKCSNQKKHSTMSTGALTITEIDDGDYVGLEIDCNQRFVLNDFTVTHNCANAFSVRFEVDTVDKVTGKRYVQTWENNMSVCHEAVITKCSKASYTKVSFVPDYHRMGGKKLDDSFIGLVKRRVLDLASCTRENVIVYFNGEKLNVRTFAKFVDLFLGARAECPRVFATIENEGGTSDYKWDIAVALSEDGGFKQFSLVNGIATPQGGTHVNYIRDQIVRKVGKLIKQKKGAGSSDIKPGFIRENLWLFVNAVVENPSFSSQTKEALSLEQSKFGFKHTLSDEFVASIEKRLQISKRAMGVAELRKDSALKTTDGRKKRKIVGMIKLEDANKAGTRESEKCCLIVTEGDSAKTFAMDGLQLIGRDYYGVFPLKGKLLNVRNATKDQLLKNEEIRNLKEIFGLRKDKDYTDDISSLRYGRVMLLTDQDVDGSHIKGLFINWIESHYPTLLKNRTFLSTFITPIVRLQPTNTKLPAKLFFNMSDFEQFKESNGGLKGYKKPRYLKGLGTSEKREAREYFADFGRFIKEFKPRDPTLKEMEEHFQHAFDSGCAQWRKDWLSTYDETLSYDYTEPVFYLEDFVDRELKHFSIYDNTRSIPNAIDGLKVGQRKILWAMRKMNLYGEEKTKKVLSLAGDVSSQSSYHHGEKSLMDTIVKMAQSFVDSNNVNLLYPNGQFGSRLEPSGSDASDPRYIFTHLQDITKKIFRPEDDAVLRYERDDEDKVIEPRYYCPIISMTLVNGCAGIGTGYSTNIPKYNPVDVIDRHIALIDDNANSLPPLQPWYRSFNGTIVAVEGEAGQYDALGTYERVDDVTVRVTEIPVGQSFMGYKTFIENHHVDNPAVKEKKNIDLFIKDYVSETYTSKCDYHITFVSKAKLDACFSDDSKGILKKMKLSSRLSTRNMYLFGADGAIKKFETPEDIIRDHYAIRMPLYEARKQHQLESLQNKIRVLDRRQRFIQLVLDEKLIIRKRPKAEIAAKMRDFGLVEDSELDADESAGDSAEDDAIFTPVMKSLLRITQLDLTKEEVEKALAKIDSLRAEHDELNGTPVKVIWRRELVELRKEMVAFLKNSSLDAEDAELEAMIKARDGKNKKKKIVKTTKKSRK